VAITETGSRSVATKSHADGAGNFLATAHTTDGFTDILLCFEAMEGNENPQATEFCTFDGDDLTLIHDTGSTGSNTDVRILVYGMVSPGPKTANAQILTQFNAFPLVAIWVNLNGTDITSVAAASNFISESVNTVAASTNVLSSGGAAGNGLMAFGVAKGNDMNPSSIDSGMVEIVEDVTDATTSDFAFNLSRNFTSAPIGPTITWNTLDECTAVLVELVAAATDNTVQRAAYHYKNHGKLF